MLSDRVERPAVSASQANHLFPKTVRVRKRREYQVTFSKGRKVITPVLVFFVLPQKGDSARVGFAVSRKVGNAVKRNLVKRRIREAFRVKRTGLPVVDVVCVPRRGALKRSLTEYHACFDMLIRELENHRARPRRDS